jgi:hypothetical protein
MSSEALVVLNDNPNAMALSGVGLGSRLFDVKPSTIEIVQKSTRQENVEIGKLRNTATNEHYTEMRWVLLGTPQEQRQYFEKGTQEFSRDKKLCFSLDNVSPHPRAKDAQAPFCATCPMGDINWEKWRKTKSPSDLPPCHKYWHLVFADRTTQMIHYFNVKGTSVMPFERDMQNLARLLAQMTANVKAQNKAIRLANSLLTDPNAPRQADERMPNIFDIVFTVRTEQQVKGGPYVLRCEKFQALRAEDRAEFGQIYLDFLNSRKNTAASEIEEEEAATNEANAAVTGASPTVQAGAPLGPVTGEVVGKEEPITI